MRIAVVGLHGGEAFGRRALAALADAEVVVAAPRHKALVDLGAAQTVLELSGPLPAVLDQIDAHLSAGRSVAVLASGDPGFFGIVRVLGERFGPSTVEVHPAPSSVSLAFGRIGMSWDDAVVVSAHGRPAAAAVDSIQRAAKVAVLTSPESPPELLGRLLADAGCPARAVTIASRLGEPGESLTTTDLAGLAAGTFDPLSVVIFLGPAPAAGSEPGPTLRWGLPEHEFDTRAGLITKSEVRAVALGQLDLPTSGVLWDVGAGSGSVGIECARLAPRLRVIAVERNADDADRIRANAAQHGAAIEVIVGSAPAALAGLPAPDRVFVGGGGTDVVRAAFDALRPGGTLVATHVLVDRAAEAWRLLGSTTQIAASRAVPIADGFRLEAQNPVFISWGTKP
jgi:precorrin-6Y C5,15-methyltransferase (decarboxylating)